MVNVARDFAAAREWDIRQQLALTPAERFAAAAELKRRVWPEPNPDIREWHRQKKKA